MSILFTSFWKKRNLFHFFQHEKNICRLAILFSQLKENKYSVKRFSERRLEDKEILDSGRGQERFV